MLVCQREKFSLDENVHYLNCAYMSPILKQVEEVGIQGIRGKRNPFRVTPDDFFKESELLRLEFSKLVNNPYPNRVVLIPSVSYGISMLAKNISLDSNENIVLAANQFPSNVYPWLRLAEESKAIMNFVSKPESKEINWTDEIVSAINSNTRIVALSHTHWADGTKFNLKEIRRKCDEFGTLLIIDGTQSIGALPFDIKEIRPDALICAGYKWLMGPYSLGIAYIGDRFLEGVPAEENWINRLNSENFSGLVDYEKNYQKGALRYEVGEHSNFILVPMLLKAIQQLNTWGPENIISYCENLAQKPIEKLKEMGFKYNEPSSFSYHLFGLTHPTIEMQKLNEELTNRKIYASTRGNSLRISVNVYNTKADFDALLAACENII